MKKYFFIIGCVLVLVLALFLIITSKSKSDTPETEVGQNTLVSDIKSSITVTPLSSDVSIKEIDMKTFNVIQSPASTTIGSSVKTSENGRALIESSFGHPIAIDFNSDVIIANSDSEKNKTSIELTSGGIWARAKKLVEKGEYFEIKTGNAVAVVRGTSFGLTYANNLTTLVVAEGEVSLFNKNKDTGEIIAESEIVVKAGYKGTIFKDEKPKMSALDASDKNSPWFKFNTKTDDVNSDNLTTPPKDPSHNSPLKTSDVPSKNVQNSSSATNPVLNTSSNSTSVGGSSTGGSSIPVNTTGGDVGGVVIRSISPKTISLGDSKTFIVVTGSGLKNAVQVEMGELPMPNFSVTTDGSLRFNIDAQIGPGTYDISIMLSDESYFTIPNAFTVSTPTSTNTYRTTN